MTQRIYLWSCSGKDEVHVHEIMAELQGGLVDTRKKDSWISISSLRAAYGDHYYHTHWAYKNRSQSISQARRQLSPYTDHYRFLCNWILQQPGPVLFIDIFHNHEEHGIAGKLAQFLRKDGFLVTEWDKRHREQPHAQLGLFDS